MLPPSQLVRRSTNFPLPFVWVIGLLLGAGVRCAAEVPRHFFLEIDIAIERGGQTGVLFDFGDGIWGENSSFANVPPGTSPQTVRLPLPTRPLRNLRFDPTADDAESVIAALRLVDDRGIVLERIDPKTLRPRQQIESIAPEGAGVRVRPTRKADDPILRLDFPPLQKRMHDVTHRSTIGRGTVLWLGLALASVLGFNLVTAWRAASRGEETGVQSRAAALVAGAAIFCAVFGARLAWLNLYSRSTPFWDEWEGDVLYILIPFQGGFLDWGALFMPQWEHRILLTRVITLVGTVLNGEWEPRVAMTVSATMFAALIALIGTALLATRRWPGLLAAVGLVVAGALPFDVNNLLWGGQTQMYGLLLLAVSTITLATAPRVTPGILAAAAGGSALSLFTMGAGMLGPACGAGICLVRGWFEPAQRRARLGLAAVFFAAALAGVALHTSSRAHVPFYATTWAQFEHAFIGALAWPLPPTLAMVALAWTPWVANGILILRRRAASPLEWLAVGLGGWALVNAIALGYARQYEGPPFDSRFFTSLSLGALGSVLSSIALLARVSSWRWQMVLLGSSASVATAWVIAGSDGIAGARANFADRVEMDRRVRHFLATGDRGPMREKPPCFGPFADDAADRLESRLLQPILTAPYRRALAERGGAARPAAPIEPGPLTVVIRTLMKAGWSIAGLGTLGFGLVAVARVRKSDSDRPLALSALWRRALADWRAQPRELRVDRARYIAAAGITVGWFWLYNSIRRDGLVDEPGHLADVHHFLDNKSGWPESMPMLPGYHFVVLSLWRLHPAMSTLTAARLTTCLLTLVGFAAFALTWRKLHGKPAGRATLLLALLPLTQPFTGLAYTDMPALALVFCALWAQVSGHRALAALALAEASAMRQTNLAWAALLIAWEFFREDEMRATFPRRVAWVIGLLMVAGMIVMTTGRLTVGSQHGNAFTVNLAAVHFAALLALVLGLPVWLRQVRAMAERGGENVRARPARAVLVVAVSLIGAGVFAATYANPHIWNRELFWDGCTFTLLRNWPLVWIDAHRWLRVFSGANVMLMLVAVGTVIAGQRHVRELWLVVILGALPVLTNGLVEPRYLIPAAGMALLFFDFDELDWRRLAVWWALLCAIHAPFVMRALSLW